MGQLGKLTWERHEPAPPNRSSIEHWTMEALQQLTVVELRELVSRYVISSDPTNMDKEEILNLLVRHSF